MTCVLAVIDDDGLVIAGDSAVSDLTTGSIVTSKDPKVFARRGLAVGFCGSPRVMQILRNEVELPAFRRGETADVDTIVRHFVNPLHEVLLRKKLLKRAVEEPSWDAQFIVATRDDIFLVGDDLQVNHVDGRWTAIGSGTDLALGSLHASAQLGAPTHLRVRLALKAAQLHNNQVRPPFRYLRMRKKR